MTMYARAIDVTVSFGNPEESGDHFTLSVSSGVKVLPLWAAQFPGFGRLWAAGHVVVATDAAMTQIITSIPSSELPGGTTAAQQAVLDSKAPLASPAFTGTPTGITKAHVGLALADNTPDASKPVSTAQAAAIAAKLSTSAVIDNTDGTVSVGSVKAMGPITTVVVRSDNTAPAIGQTTYYNATSGNRTPSMPALSGLAVGARLWLRRDPADVSTNTVTVSCPNPDTFYSSGTTSLTLPILGEQREFQVVSVSGTKYWAPGGSLNPVAGLDARYLLKSRATVNVKDYGATGDGVTNDTAAIESAFTAGAGGIYFPPGTYVYTGTGMSHTQPYIVGAGRQRTIIVLGATSYLLNVSVVMGRLDMRDLSVQNGKGAIKHTYTGADTIGLFVVDNCYFSNYTECAIADDSSDMPYWKLTHCQFWSADTLNTIGVAFSGLTDNCCIDSCSFVMNRVHIKARKGGNNLSILNCDLIKFSTVNTNGPRVDVWYVPDTTPTTAGQGATISACKFGNENLVAGDYRILYADEGSGTSNGNMMPNLGANSTGYVVGHFYHDNNFVGTGAAGSNSIIYSTTPNVYHMGVHHNQIMGSVPKFALEFRTAPTTPDRVNSNNLFGPWLGLISSENAIFPLSNAVGVGYQDDPANWQQLSGSVRRFSGGSTVNYSALTTAAITAWSTAAATLAGQTDAVGGSNAVKVTFTGSAGTPYTTLSAMTPGVPVWVELDVKNPNDGSQLSQFQLYVQDAGAAIHWRRVIDVPIVANGWVTYAFSFTPRTAGTTPLVVISNADTGILGTILVGRPRVYHSTERLNVDGRFVGQVVAPGGVVTKVTSGTPTDTDNANNGAMIVKSADSSLWSRVGGSWRQLSSGRPSQWQPGDHGLLGWSLDPSALNNTQTLTAGLLYLVGIQIPAAITITNVIAGFNTGGATLTSGQNFAALYQGGNLLAATADQSANWASAGTKIMALTSPQAVTAGTVYVAYYFNGTTSPAFFRGGSGGIINVNLGAAYRYATGNSGLTTAMPATLGTLTQSTLALFAGIS